MTITATGVLLDAIAEAVTPAEGEVIDRGKAVLSRLESGDFPFPWLAMRSTPLRTWTGALRDCLEEHESVRLDEAEARELTEDIRLNTETVIIAVREACGDKAAAFVSGTEGGEWA
jgi:hypothetical protein